jgi:hypothetical protein
MKLIESVHESVWYMSSEEDMDSDSYESERLLRRQHTAKTKELHYTRRYLHNLLQHEGRLFVLLMVIFISLLLVDNTVIHPLYSQASPFITLQTTTRMDNTLSSFGSNRLTHNKLLFVLVDGMSYSHSIHNSELSALLLHPQFHNNSKQFKLKAQAPTVSVPNWATLLSVSTPFYRHMY